MACKITIANPLASLLPGSLLSRLHDSVRLSTAEDLVLSRSHDNNKRPADNGLYMVDKEFHYIINECNKFHLTRLDFLSLQKDTYIPIQFFINNFSTYNNKKIQRYYSLQH